MKKRLRILLIPALILSISCVNVQAAKQTKLDEVKKIAQNVPQYML
jgi:hypothetical protein